MAGVRIAWLDRRTGRPASYQAGVIRHVEVRFLRIQIVARAAPLPKYGSEVIIVGDLFLGSGRSEDLDEQCENRGASKNPIAPGFAGGPPRTTMIFEMHQHNTPRQSRGLSAD